MIVANANPSVHPVTGVMSSLVINNSSSQGPTDDGRVKPDIAADGTALFSTSNETNTSYATETGTSMASPSVAGGLILLQEHYNDLHPSEFMRSATLKGLVCHTALDDVASVGPDPKFGWGLLNAKKAAETISNNGLSAWVSEERLNQGQTFTMTVASTGGANNPLMASITWTDVPGEANNGQRLTPNDTFRALVNDLDIRITKDGSTYYPWRLDVASPTSPAIRNGDNNVDNIEVVAIENAQPGNYQIVVSHKGIISTPTQNYSLIFTGNNVVLNNAFFDENSFVLYPNPANDFVGVNLGTVEADSYDLIDLQGRIINSGSLVGKNNETISLSGLQSGVYFVKINSNSKSVVKKIIKK